MPPDLGKLTNPQTLPNFVLGKESGSSGIGELGPLLHLCGTLSISRLENVNGVEDATMANLGHKNGIDGLLLEWNKGEIADLDVLRSLQPPRMLKELTVNGYGGVRFPTWMENPSIFSKMVLMRLEDCNGCRLLPPLGLLVSLKKLIIVGMSGVENIGSDFYGVGCLKPFPILESLSFETMENWENWSQLETKAGIEGFPQLKELSLRRCPKLNGKLHESLPSLETLVVRGCEQLVISIPAEGLTRLKDLKVHGCKEMSSVCQDELRQLTSLEHLQIDDSSLRHPTLMRVGEEARQVELCLPTKVQTLELSYFCNLVKVPEVMHLTLLEELHIFGCTSLTCFPKSGLQSSLRVLWIESCENLISLVRDDEYSSNCTPPPNSNSNCLELLKIQNCPSLKSISSAVTGSLPVRFKNLYIKYCHALERLSSGKLPGTLRNLEIHYCYSLIYILSEGELPEALESLRIEGCKINLRSIPEGLHHLINLSELCIIECKNLVPLREGGLPASNLRELVIDTVAYPKGMLQDLIFLQKLEIPYSEGLTRLLVEEGFPPNLIFLIIYDLKEIKPLFHRRFLHRLTSLRSLSLIGEATDMVSFLPEPENEHEKDGRMGTLMLPKSLISLHISEFENLEKLSTGFQCLTSLQFLSIRACKKLKSLPVGGLPLCLTDLVIHNCPLLKKQCTRYAGPLWPLIAHIPGVHFFN
ncbi:putative disease resistance protein At3g14460 [Ziziphus jujuba]|uniref:Disease resistance protein At3g14460 n=1 Tax=Ziziphus jujuba TaxID=326968 RepID=A0ABM4A2E9_ZIZJJ|nr:putative disease resistance protein At3g14460 [Ziziphus jujuba]